MQDRYAGDIDDYVKFALLRHLAPGRRIGVAWYLHPDEDQTDDGRHTAYLDNPAAWRHLDPDLFDLFARFRQSGGARTIGALEAMGILDAVYFREPLATAELNGRQRIEWRAQWFDRLMTHLSACDLVFADPDNGLIDDNPRRRRRKKFAKSLPLREALRLSAGRSALFYHRNSRHKGGHEAEVRHWLAQLGGDAFAIRARAYSPRTFFVVNPDDALRARARHFCDRWADHSVTLVENGAISPSASPSAATETG